MDDGYLSNLYAMAIWEAEFFLKPEVIESGQDYYRSFQETKQKNAYNTWPRVFHAYIKEMVPAAKASKRDAKHISSEEMSDASGKIYIKKGERRGPVFYEAHPNKDNRTRLEYSLKCAVVKARTGLFDEKIGSICKRCFYKERCRKLGTSISRKQQVLDLMNDLKVEPT
jgi:hypothetical protein